MATKQTKTKIDWDIVNHSARYLCITCCLLLTAFFTFFIAFFISDLVDFYADPIAYTEAYHFPLEGFWNYESAEIYLGSMMMNLPFACAYLLASLPSMKRWTWKSMALPAIIFSSYVLFGYTAPKYEIAQFFGDFL